MYCILQVHIKDGRSSDARRGRAAASQPLAQNSLNSSRYNILDSRKLNRSYNAILCTSKKTAHEEFSRGQNVEP